MDEKFTIASDDAKAVLAKESEFILNQLAAAAHLTGDDRKYAIDDAMVVADRYNKLFDTVSGAEQKHAELDVKNKETSECAVQSKRAARIEMAKSIGETVLKCGLLFAQGALYVWGVKKTFDFEGYHTASTSVGRSLLNNVSSLFIKK